MCSSSAPPVGKNVRFTPLALTTSIAALALSAPNVPHMASTGSETRALLAGPLRNEGGGGVSVRCSDALAAIGGTVGVGGLMPDSAAAGPLPASSPSCAAAAADAAPP